MSKLTQNAYRGACGADINEDWHGDTQFLYCSRGCEMQCEDVCYPRELCEDCGLKNTRPLNDIILMQILNNTGDEVCFV